MIRLQPSSFSLETETSGENKIRTCGGGDGRFHAVDRRRTKFSRPCFDVRDNPGKDFGRSFHDPVNVNQYPTAVFRSAPATDSSIISIMKNKLVLILSMVVTLCFSSGTSRTSAVNFTRATTSPLVTGKSFDTADLKKLRWIEGTWRGTGGGVPPFVERYKFENDRTLAVEGLDGEILEKSTGVTRFELKDGQFGGGDEGSRWVASSIDDKSITFEPVAKARNSFRWERESQNSWKAILSWPANDKGPAKQRIYQMERWPKQ